MKVLNPELYKNLEKIFGEVKVSSSGDTGAFTLPDSLMKKNKKKRKKYAHVTDWGEVYHVNCPSCGDTRHRLYFSYLCGCSYKRNKSTPRVYFSRYIFQCKNENCRKDLKPYIKQLDFETVDLNQLDPDEVNAKTPSKETYNAYLSVQVTVPSDMLRLVAENIPGYCTDYLQDRGFSIEELDTKYACKYIPAGSKWVSQDGEKEKVFYEERLFIPIIQSRKLVSWQARLFREAEKGKCKYYNMPGSRSCIYNMDTALQFSNVMIVEGVTDVWRCGDQSMALLGANLTSSQLFCLKTIWGMDGRAVFLVESDKKEEMLGYAKKCIDNKAFVDGVSLIDLNGKDPAELSTNQITEIFNKGLENAVTEKDKLKFMKVNHAQT